MKNSRQILSVFVLFFSSQCFSTETNTDLQTKIIVFLETYKAEIADKGYRSKYEMGNIDPRLVARKCSKALELSFNRKPIEQSNVTILAQCSDHKPWKLYVSIQFDIYGRIITAAETIPKGALITRPMLVEKDQIVNEGRHIGFSSTKKVIGKIAKRTIRSNMVISANQLKAPSLIKRGDRVIITAANSAISVSMNGTALMDGKLGQQISIRNTDSKRTIRGRVTDRGRVLVAL
ncbi:MAG: flagella basal body P-ring formation protein FlgA [Pseudohongiellaceae bacterium]|jgi:flagella basal body P-ring formation protein FlgA